MAISAGLCWVATRLAIACSYRHARITAYNDVALSRRCNHPEPWALLFCLHTASHLSTSTAKQRIEGQEDIALTLTIPSLSYPTHFRTLFSFIFIFGHSRVR